MKHHVKPYLGQKKPTQITASDLRKLYGRLKAHGRVTPLPGQTPGLSSTTVHGIHTTLHQALKAAVDQGLMPSNPADRVETPQVAHKFMNILNDEQGGDISVSYGERPHWHDFFYTELTTGLRLGEICGLMWFDFDERKGTLSVNRTLHREKGGRLVAGGTKTCAETRKIILPSSTAELLRTRKKSPCSPWIFHDPLHPEAPLNPSTAYHQPKKFLAQTDLPGIRFHDLRHTFATMALQNGVDIKTVSSMLGHYDAGFTLRTYTHATRQKQDEAAQTMGSFMEQVM